MNLDSPVLPATPGTLEARYDEMRAALVDIAFGADMMLAPPFAPSGAIRGYIEEIRRVARAAL
jgi:hypothetical protein